MDSIITLTLREIRTLLVKYRDECAPTADAGIVVHDGTRPDGTRKVWIEAALCEFGRVTPTACVTANIGEHTPAQILAGLIRDRDRRAKEDAEDMSPGDQAASRISRAATA